MDVWLRRLPTRALSVHWSRVECFPSRESMQTSLPLLLCCHSTALPKLTRVRPRKFSSKSWKVSGSNRPTKKRGNLSKSHALYGSLRHAHLKVAKALLDKLV